MNVTKYLLDIVTKALNKSNDTLFEIQNIKSNIDYLVDLEQKINRNENDLRFNFLNVLNENQITDIIETVTDGTTDLYNEILNIKDIIKENKNLPDDFRLTKEQINTLNKFRILINKKISFDKYILDQMKDENDNTLEKLNSLKNKVNKTEIILNDDYDLINKIILEFEQENPYEKLNEVIEYININNLLLYSKDENANNKALLSDFNINNNNLDNRHYSDDSLSDKINNAKEIIKIFNDNFDALNDYCKGKLLSISDYDNAKVFTDLLKENKIDKILSDNYRNALYTILVDSNIDKYKQVEKSLKNEFYLDVEQIENIYKYLPNIFVSDSYLNFVANYTLFMSDTFDINKIIENNINILCFENNHVRNYLSEIKKYGLDASKIIYNLKVIFESDLELILYNARLLDSYGYDLKSDNDYESYAVLKNKNLRKYLDIFVEMKLNDYIHKSLSKELDMVRSLIIKRTFYLYKNNNESSSNYKALLPGEYYDLIKGSGEILNENKISKLILKYPILDMIEGHSLQFMGDNNMSKVKKKTELIFDDLIISRQKFYYVFNVLCETDLKMEDKVYYSLVYNSSFDTEQDILKIKSLIYPKEELE